MRNSLEHNIIENVNTSLSCLFKSFLNNCRSKSVNLDIHLNSCDTLMSTANLEVHIAKEVLKTLNVNHCHEVITVGESDKSAGDSGNRSLDRNSGIHKCECGATNRTLRSRTVRRKNLGNKSHSVGKFLNRGNYRSKCSLSKCAMTDLTSSGASAGLGFTYRIAREIVLVHISLCFFLVKSVELLCITYRAEGCNCKNLCLTSCKESGAVNTGENTYFRSKGTNFINTSAVNTLTLIEPCTNDLFLKLVYALIDHSDLFRVNLIELSMYIINNGSKSLVTNILIVCVKSEFNAV